MVMDKNIRIALAQIDVQPGRVEENLSTVRSAIHQAKIQQADLVVFPEMVTTGYCDDLHQFGDPFNENSPADQIREMANENNLWVAFGFPEQVKGQKKLFNAIVLVDSQGTVQSKYYKIHLFTPMRDDFFFQPGSKIKIIQTKFGIIGLSICYDLRFPELYRLLAHKGAEIILCPAQWPCPRQEHWDILLRARSIENQLILVGVNRIGETESNSFCGGSGIIDPWGNPLLKLPSTQKGVFSVEISRELVKKIRKDINYLSDVKLSINL